MAAFGFPTIRPTFLDLVLVRNYETRSEVVELEASRYRFVIWMRALSAERGEPFVHGSGLSTVYRRSG
jgi:hypothetical protein